MQLAKKTGIGKSTLNNIENDKVSPTLFQLETIAIALKVKVTDLFESEYEVFTHYQNLDNQHRTKSRSTESIDKILDEVRK